jgi:glycerate kinase
MELTGFDEALAAADLVLTGEGRIDEQTGFGKTAMGVAQRARDAGKKCISFGGGATPEGIAALGALGAIVVPVIEQPQTVEEAIAAGTAPLIRAAERAARLVSLG